jgi:hypothetical protein
MAYSVENSVKQRRESQSQFVQFSNSNSLEYFPENTNQSFRNNLIKPIATESCHSIIEAALLEVVYTPLAPQTQNVFPTDDTKEIQVKYKSYGQAGSEKRKGMSVAEALNELNMEFEKIAKEIHFEVDFADEGETPTYCTLTNGYEGKFVQLDPLFAQICGFKSIEFGQGRFRADEAIKWDVYDKLEVGSSLTVTVFDYIQKASVFCQEPTEKTIDGLMKSINDAVKSLEVSFKYNTTTLEFTGDGDTTNFVQLSEYLSKLFGIPTDHWWGEDKESFPTYSTIDFGGKKPFSVVVHCNAVEPQQQAHGLASVIKSFPFPEKFSANPVTVTFSPAIYLPVKCIPNPIETVQIVFKDEHGQPVKLLDGSITYCLVHVKERFY